MALAKNGRPGEGGPFRGLAPAGMLGLLMSLTMAGCSLAQRGDLIALADGRHMHLVCAGHGAPAVIFESGFGATAAAWDKVTPTLAKQTRVCAYDRAGYGTSDPGPLPRDGAAIAKDLDDTLRAARISGPFVMVGHSAGGLYVRLFADRRPKDVVGMVLVDPSVDHQDRQLSMFGPRAADLSGIRQRVEHCLEVARGWAQEDKEGPTSRCRDRGKILPAAAWETQLSELDTLWRATSDEVTAGRASYGDLPLIVLTAGRLYEGVSEPLKDALSARWRAVHRDVANRSSRGQELLVDSPHLIMVLHPEAVIQAVDEVLQQIKPNAKP